MKKILFFDLETTETQRITDIGAISRGQSYRGTSIKQLSALMQEADFICGHNIVQFDIPVLQQDEYSRMFSHIPEAIDTLLLSPLLFPEQPYHSLIKDYKLVSDELNNPLEDSRISQGILNDEKNAFDTLDDAFKTILFSLLSGLEGYKGFFEYIDYCPPDISDHDLEGLIRNVFRKRICSSKPLSQYFRESQIPFACVLALLNTGSTISCLPQWVLQQYPETHSLINYLSGEACSDPHCLFCPDFLDAKKALKRFFEYDSFRNFNPQDKIPLQEKVVEASLRGKSFIAVFPTGGGKSLTFQLPALMLGECGSQLTVVVSPLQSLMKDQIDVLDQRHSIVSAVSLNGLQSPIERSHTLERIENGSAHILYLSPETLRSRTIRVLLQKRTIARFIIDEAHCFSTWGQDFRVDYAYIGKFIHKLQEDKRLTRPVPVSCFTATAKRQVIEDIKKYFHETLGLVLEEYTTSVFRHNLHYRIIPVKDNTTKYQRLLFLLQETSGPVIIYVTRVKSAIQLSEKLDTDGFAALPYHGKMEREEKIKNQNSFMLGVSQIVVATTAFGMGVDKEDVSMVIHYEISNSLEGYVQEAGRAGRRADINADCIILYNENDLNIHFQLLQLSKLNHKEIDQVWRSIKRLSSNKDFIVKSAFEIAKESGWDDDVSSVDMKVKTSIAALENCGYLSRDMNVTRYYADSFHVRNIVEAKKIIHAAGNLSETEICRLEQIVQTMAKKSKKEQQVDYLADTIGLNLKETSRYINILRDLGILGDRKDLVIALDLSKSHENANHRLKIIPFIENTLIEEFTQRRITLNLKDLNEKLIMKYPDSNHTELIRSILHFWKISGWIDYERKNHNYSLQFQYPADKLRLDSSQRHDLLSEILQFFTDKSDALPSPDSSNKIQIDFSIVELKNALSRNLFEKDYSLSEIEEALLFLGRTRVIEHVDGFFVYYPALRIETIEKNSRKRYTQEDYSDLLQYYQHRTEQIHIAGEYARKMLEDHKSALSFVDDYFTLHYADFLKKYFPNRKTEIERPLTLEKFNRIINDVSSEQLEVVKDNSSQHIMVTAGPGSGKTRVLVHKIASLIMMEDVKPDQFLMLTFSRIAAMELKSRLSHFLGNMAYRLDVFTFHGFCFELHGIQGNIRKSENIIDQTVKKISENQLSDEVISKKSILLIDEFQDVGESEFALINLILKRAETIRSIIVGDDDQNIFEFRGASVKNFSDFSERYRARSINLLTNYRSAESIVQFSNTFVHSIINRMKRNLLIPFRKEEGEIKIFEYRTEHISQAVADQIMKERPKGSTAVLTFTNEEAALIHGLLEQKGIKARLIISDNHFSVAELVEFRTFAFRLEAQEDNAFGRIGDHYWDQCVQYVHGIFQGSTTLLLFKELVGLFENTYSIKTVSEWTSFVKEIKIEDAYIPGQNTVVVTTMHKSKGKEFDHVYIMLRNYKIDRDDKKRLLYVAMTRAKDSLSIHTNTHDLADFSKTASLQYSLVHAEYEQPREISIQLGHKDVYLGWFKKKENQSSIKNLIAGNPLFTGSQKNSLYTSEGREVLSFSKQFASEIEERWFKKGYFIDKAQARFILVWKDINEEKEYRIVLPALYLKKR